jgi:hypothetical protein
MNREQVISTDQSRAITTDGAWGLRQPGHVRVRAATTMLRRSTGMWGLKRTTLECELNQEQLLTVVTNRRRRSDRVWLQDLPSRKGPRPATLRGPLHIQCNGHGDPQHLGKLTSAVLSWPHVETNLPDDDSSNSIPLRLQETAMGYNFAAFIRPRELPAYC